MLGVDGGNTKTLAAVADEPGRTLGMGRAGAADIYNAPKPAVAVEAMAAAVEQALAAAGVPAGELAAAVFSLAGADWPEDFTLLEGTLPRAARARGRAAASSTTRWVRCAAARTTGRASPSSPGPTTRSARAGRTATSSTSASGPTARAGATSRGPACAPSTTRTWGWGPRPRSPRMRSGCSAPATRSTCCTSSRAAAGCPSRSPTGSRRSSSTPPTRATPSRRRSSRRRAASLGRQGTRLRGPDRPAARRHADRAHRRRLRPPDRAARRRRDGRAAGRRRRAPPGAADRGRAAARARPARRDGRRRRGRGRAPVSCTRRKERPMGGIALDGVSKVFPGGVVAVDDVDLEIGDGEFMVLVGPSGCGKSTLLRMIAGLEGVSSGTIRIGDRDVTELAPRSRDIAMVFQNYALYPHMRVWDNLAFALKLRRTPEARDARAGRRRRRRARAQGAHRPQAGRALGRPAPARRDRPRDGARAAGLPDGRAALQPRREAARRHARRARAAARPARRHDRLRHPRPGRGDDARRPRRGAARRHRPAVRHARAAVRGARRTCSSRRSWARRR